MIKKEMLSCMFLALVCSSNSLWNSCVIEIPNRQSSKELTMLSCSWIENESKINVCENEWLPFNVKNGLKICIVYTIHHIQTAEQIAKLEKRNRNWRNNEEKIEKRERNTQYIETHKQVSY